MQIGALIALHFRRFAVLLAAAALAAPLRAASLNPEFGVGDWIWDHEVHDRQECRFVRVFKVPEGAKVKSALLRITADNSYQLFFDGEYIGRGGDWRVLIEYDVRLLLGPGEHTLAVSALNDFDVAGFLFGLRVVLGDGSVIEISSDASWRVAPNDAVAWERKSTAWDRWPSATLERPFNPKALVAPQVYHAPISQPIKTEFWQQSWVHVALLTATLASSAVGFFLTSRLILKTQSERVIRRERARIALDLHDSLGGGLTQLLLLGETSRRRLQENAQEANGWSQQVCDQSRELLQGMNETVWLINSERDTIRDFASYVAKYAESFFRASPIRCRLDIQAGMTPLPCNLGVRRNLFLAVKEALNNVLRHSQATAVQVAIGCQRQELIVTIQDDGCGFDPMAENCGNGLGNMRMRAAEAGAQFTLRSHPGGGCGLEFRLPLASERLRLAWFSSRTWRRLFGG